MMPQTVPTASTGPVRRQRRYSMSNLTRLLCAGARLDPVFAKQVVEVLLKNRERFAAPAYGYDAVPVLGHALATRGLRRARTAAVILGFVVTAVLFVTTGIGVLGSLAVLLWLTWVAIFVERLVTLQNAVTYLRPRRGGPAFDGRYPRSDRLGPAVVDEIAEEQDPSTGLVYYGGYLPFVGAGERVRNWSFAVLLDAVPPGLLTGSERREPDPFTVDELTTYIQERLNGVLVEESLDGQRIEQLVVERRWYRKALSVRRPDALQEEVETLRHLKHGPQLYDSAREYLCIRVGSWEQELVTSVFVAFDLKGRTLYSELHGYVLPPINPLFADVDRLPERLDGTIAARVAWHAVKSVLNDLVGILAAVMGALAAVARFITGLFTKRSSRRFAAEDLTRYAAGLVDYGAVVSIRELASISGFRHFFQQIDAEKYVTIVERRLMEIVLDFLQEHHVDTSDYRERQTAVLNFGIIHSGSGDVRNTGTQSFGPGSSARGSNTDKD